MAMTRHEQIEHDEVVAALKRYLRPEAIIMGQQFEGKLVGYTIEGVGYVGVREQRVEARLRRALHVPDTEDHRPAARTED